MHVLPRVVAALLITLAAGGCAARQAPVLDPLSGAPADFSLDVTVAVAGTPDDDGLRPGRFVLFADGTLHHDSIAEDGDPGRAGWLPEPTRELDRRQVAEVWSVLHQVGLDDARRGAPLTNLNLIRPADGEAVIMVAVHGDGERWMFIDRSDSSSGLDPGMERLVRYLEALSWAGPEPEPLAEAPRRYDFGDDPYRPYR